LLAFAIGAPAASAKTVTLHLFSKRRAARSSTRKGTRCPRAHRPQSAIRSTTPGSITSGNHKHHAAKPNGTDHLRCTITSVGSMGPMVLCSGQIAIGGSMLLANDETVTLSVSPPPTRINGGTGIYRHARGLLTPTSIGNNTDFTIRVSY
jgi:hypothetical protein